MSWQHISNHSTCLVLLVFSLDHTDRTTTTV